MFGKAADQNTRAAEMPEQIRGRGRAHQEEQRGAADNLKTRLCKDGFQSARGRCYLSPRLFDPSAVGQSRSADGERRPGYRPGTEFCGKARGQMRLRKRKTEPDTAEAEKFAERSQ